MMMRWGVVLAGGLAVAGCSSMPSLDILSGSGGAATVQIESEPPGAEARASDGQTCRTPCALAVPPADFSVTFSLAGYQPQTVPVRFAAPDARSIDSDVGSAPPPVIDPNPVYAELTPTPPTARKPRAQPRKPRPQSAAAPAPAPAPAAAPTAAPPPIAVPEPAAPASPWPPAAR